MYCSNLKSQVIIKMVLQSIANGNSNVYVDNDQYLRLSWDASDVSSITEKLLVSSTHNRTPKIQYQKKDEENRTKLKCAVEQDPSDERELQLKLVDSQLILENFPYLVLYEWEVVPDRSEFGKGDLVFTNGCGVYAVVETKYINCAHGRTSRKQRNHHRKKVFEQANKYRRYVPNFFDDVMMVYAATYTNEDSLIWVHGDHYDPNFWKKIILDSIDGVKVARDVLLLKSSSPSSRASLPTGGRNSYVPNGERQKYHQEDLYESRCSSPRANRISTTYHRYIPHRGHTSSFSNGGRQKYSQEEDDEDTDEDTSDELPWARRHSSQKVTQKDSDGVLPWILAGAAVGLIGLGAALSNSNKKRENDSSDEGCILM